MTGPKTGIDQFTFTGCEDDHVPCASGGDLLDPGNGPEVPGTIVTRALAATLIEPTPGVAWTQLTGIGGGGALQATFHCGEKDFEVTGLVSGTITPLNAMSKKVVTTFGQAVGEQALAISVFVGTTFLEAPLPTLASLTYSTANAAKIEVKTG